MSMVTSLQQNIEQLRLKLEQLPPRDRLALIILTVFLLVFGVGSSVWFLHKAADNAQAKATEQRELLLWMRSQAANIQANPIDAQPLNVLIQNAAQQQGLTVSQTPMGDQAQVTVTHQSFAVLGTWLTRLAEQGIAIDELDIEQLGSGELQLKAVMQLGG
jgi:type II secretory pathway component PulM